jgi:hypothetical protein
MELLLKMKNKNPLLNMQISDVATLHQRSCRICLESEPVDDLITPCWCSGSMSHIHSKCLEEWISQTTNPENKIRCNVCKFKYVKSNPPKYCFKNMCFLLTRGERVVGVINILILNLFVTYFLFGILSLTVGTIDWNFNLIHVAIVCAVFYWIIFIELMYAAYVSYRLNLTKLIGPPIAYMSVWGGVTLNVWIWCRPELASVFVIGIFPAHFLITNVYCTLLKKIKTKVKVLSIQNIADVSLPDALQNQRSPV